MEQSDIGKRIIVIISDNETMVGTVVTVLDEFIFEIVNSHGKPSVWNLKNIYGYKEK